MTKIKQLSAIALLGLMTTGLVACGDTWDGIKKDTGENAEAVGDAAEKAGDKIKDATQ